MDDFHANNDAEVNENLNYEDMLDMLQVASGVIGTGLVGNEERNVHGLSETTEEPTAEAARFYRLLQDYKEPLVLDGSNVSKLDYIVKLLHLKCLNHWSDNSFTQLLKFQNETLGCNLPNSFAECRKIISDLGFGLYKN